MSLRGEDGNVNKSRLGHVQARIRSGPHVIPNPSFGQTKEFRGPVSLSERAAPPNPFSSQPSTTRDNDDVVL